MVLEVKNLKVSYNGHIAIDNINLDMINDLKSYIYTKSPGDEVKLNVVRGKINKEIVIKLGKK